MDNVGAICTCNSQCARSWQRLRSPLLFARGSNPLCAAWREEAAAESVQAAGAIVLRRPAPWWNARCWAGLALGRERWAIVDEVWCGYSNPFDGANERPHTGLWPGPLIAGTLRFLFSRACSGVDGRDTQTWLAVRASSDCLGSFPSARRVGVVGINDDELLPLACMRGLRDLELCDTTIIGGGLEHLAGMRELRRLQLLNVPLDTKGKQQLAKLKTLEELVVWDDGWFPRFPDSVVDRNAADTFDDDLLARLGR